MSLQDFDYQKKPLSPEDDWNLIYQEALEARKILYEAENNARVKLEQSFTRKILFLIMSIILIVVATLLTSIEYFINGDLHSYINVVIILAAFIFSFIAFYSNHRAYTLKNKIATAKEILEQLDRELFSIDRKKLN